MSATDVDARITGIAAKLRAAAEGGLQPFGWEGHGFRLRPPLAEAEVAAFERRHGIELPAGYRAFVTRVGDGWAGPAYGLYPLEAVDARERPWPPPDGFLRAPFPHTSAFNPDTDPDTLAIWDRADRGELSDEEADRHDAWQTAGTLVLCHEGCGYHHLLVVTGPTRGQMWIDARCSDGGFAPLGADFLDWYERWLDGTLAGRHGTWWLEAPGENGG